jgi:hypothetical protein
VIFGFESHSSSELKKSYHSKVGRAKFEDALSANSAFSRLLAMKAGKREEHILMNDPNF